MAEKIIAESIKALRNGIHYDKVNGLQFHFDIKGVLALTGAIYLPFIVGTVQWLLKWWK